MKKQQLNYKQKKKSGPLIKKSSPLKVVRHNVAGIDLGSKSHFVAVINPTNKDETIIREFPVYTAGLDECIKWLLDCGTESVAMESTGVYWQHFHTMLRQAGIEVLLANSRQAKNVKGKKTDVHDAEWLMQLHSYGILEGSVILDGDELALKTYHRTREQCVRMMSQANQRIQKALIRMNIRLDIAVSDITGKTGMAIIRAILEGERDLEVLASKRDPRCKKSKEEIKQALNGFYREELLFTLEHAVKEYDFQFELLRQCESKIDALLKRIPKKEQGDIGESTKGKDIKSRKRHNKRHERTHEYSFDVRGSLFRMLGVDLLALPGISECTAMTVISEIGTDISRWGSCKQFCSWLKLAPNNQVSGGKKLRNDKRSKTPRAAIALRMAVSSLYREANPTALGVFFRRMKSKKGPKAGTTTAAHKLARMLYNLLKTGKPFIEPGAEAYLESQKERRIRNMRSQLNEWGYSVKKTEADSG